MAAAGGRPRRVLVIDESLNKRIATALRARGRRAESVAQLGLTGVKDELLILDLAQRCSAWVLVTADDRLPLEHGATLAQVGATIATLDPRAVRSWSSNPDEGSHELVHRWAHQIAEQPAGAVLSYGLNGRRNWTPRKAQRVICQVGLG